MLRDAVQSAVAKSGRGAVQGAVQSSVAKFGIVAVQDGEGAAQGAAGNFPTWCPGCPKR